jgi:hypothetical protein
MIIYSAFPKAYQARNAVPLQRICQKMRTKQIVSEKSSKSYVHSTPQSPPTNRGLTQASSPKCQYCHADRAYVLAIPGLRGERCECGVWVGQCPGCDQWTNKLRGGICQRCRHERAIALIERRKARDKATRRRKKYGNGVGQGLIVTADRGVMQ